MVSDRVSLLHTGREKTYDPALVERDFGVPPEQVVDVLALVGDKVDNVPGVPGIGQKGAQTLVREHGNLQALLEAAPELKRKAYREGLRDHADQALLSRDLVTIHTDLDVPFEPEALRMEPPDYEALGDLCREFEFWSLLKELESEGGGPEIEPAVVLDSVEAFEAAAGEMGPRIAMGVVFPARRRAGGVVVRAARRRGGCRGAETGRRIWRRPGGCRGTGIGWRVRRRWHGGWRTEDWPGALRRLPYAGHARGRGGEAAGLDCRPGPGAGRPRPQGNRPALPAPRGPAGGRRSAGRHDADGLPGPLRRAQLRAGDRRARPVVLPGDDAGGRRAGRTRRPGGGAGRRRRGCGSTPPSRRCCRL